MNTSSVASAIKKEIDICAYAEAAGLTLKRHGARGYMTTEQHDSLIFNPKENTFSWNSRSMGGSIIDFVMEYEGLEQTEAIRKLRGLLNRRPEHQHFKRPPETVQRAAQTKPFVLPEKSQTGYKRLFGYLSKTRRLDSSIVQHMVENKLIYQDVRGNACFCGLDYDGHIKYATLRTTNTSAQFRGDVAGSSKDVGFSHNLVNTQATRLFVVESPIDALSIMSILKLHDTDYNRYSYLSLGGTHEGALLYHLQKHPELTTVYLCQDNDPPDDKGVCAGDKSRQRCREALVKAGFRGAVIDKPPVGKDFNDDLKTLAAERQRENTPQNQTQNIPIERGIQHEVL